jgi:hypothetical protein
MAAYGAEYDPSIIELSAARLYSKADAVVMGSIATGMVVGAAFGSVPLTSLGAAWPIPSIFGVATLIVGALLGAIIGYTIGDARAFGYRIQAQSALCQLQIERNTAAVVQATAIRPVLAVAPQPLAAEPPLSPPVSASG